MKYGARKPSFKKSFSASTKGSMRRAFKDEIIPGYGEKDTGYFKDPVRAFKNKAYKKSSFDITDLFE